MVQLPPAEPLVVKPYKQRKRLASGETREYTIHRINLPQSLARKLGLEDDGEDVILAYIVEPKWFHLFDWGKEEVIEELLPRLREDEKLELCATLAPESICQGMKPHILLAKPEDLEQLGLNPEKPITLEDLVEAVKKRLQAETKTQPHAQLYTNRMEPG